MGDETTRLGSAFIENTGSGVKLVPTMVKVARDGGAMAEVPGLTTDAAPGWAVAMNNFGFFAATHAPSGTKVGPEHERAGNALLIVAQLAAICAAFGIDATQDARVVVAAVHDRASEPVPFPDATMGNRPMTIAEWLRAMKSLSLVGEFPWEAPGEDPGDAAVRLLEHVTSTPTPAPVEVPNG